MFMATNESLTPWSGTKVFQIQKLVNLRVDLILANHCYIRMPHGNWSPYSAWLSHRVGETPESLYKGRLVTCTVVGIVRRKPPRDVLDRANPIENKTTGYWQCPFCLKDDFRELSMVSVEVVLISLQLTLPQCHLLEGKCSMCCEGRLHFQDVSVEFYWCIKGVCNLLTYIFVVESLQLAAISTCTAPS